MLSIRQVHGASEDGLWGERGKSEAAARQVILHGNRAARVTAYHL